MRSNRSLVTLFLLSFAACTTAGEPGSGPEQPPPDVDAVITTPSPDGGADAPVTPPPPPPPPIDGSTSAGSDPDFCALPPAPAGIGGACTTSATDLCPTAALAACGPSHGCLADGRGTGKGYCTTACDPASPDSCEDGYLCVATGCTGGPAGACERIEQLASADACAPVTQVAYDTVVWEASMADGYDYLAIGNAKARTLTFETHGPGATTWTIALTIPFYGSRELGKELTRITDGDGATFVAFDVEPYNPGVFRVAAGAITAQAVTTHAYAFAGVFRTPTGAIRAVVNDVDGSPFGLYERADDDHWTFLGTTFVGRMGALADHGLITVCGNTTGGLCRSDTGLDWHDVTFPAGEYIGDLATSVLPRFAGASSSFFVMAQSDAVLRCTDDACTREALPLAYTAAPRDPLMKAATGFLTLGDAIYLHVGYGEHDRATFRRDADCWQPVHAPERALTPWGAADGRFRFWSGGGVCAIAPE